MVAGGLFDIFLGYLNLTLTFSVQTQYVEALKAYHATPEYGVWNRYHVNRLKGLFVFDQFGFSEFFLIFRSPFGLSLIIIMLRLLHCLTRKRDMG